MIFFRRTPEYDPDEDMTLRLRMRLWTSGWRGVAVLSALFVLSLVYWKGGDAYQTLKTWRAERLVHQSEAAQKKGDYKEAAALLHQATALLQRHPIILRAVARFQEATHDPEALTTYTELIKSGEATSAEKVAMCRQAFRSGRPELAVPVIRDLGSSGGMKDVAVLLTLKAEQAAAAGQWPEALELARQADKSMGTSEEKAYAKAVLARLLLLPPPQWVTGARVSEGLDLMSSLALRQDTSGLEAMDLLSGLSQNPQLSPHFAGRDFTAMVAAAGHHPEAGAALRVNAWNLRVAGQPTERESIAREFFDHFKDDPSPVARLEAGRWLNQKGMHALVLELAERSKLESRDWFALYLDAIAAQGRWEEVWGALTSKDREVPLSPVLRKLFEFRAAMETGRHPDADDAWHGIQVALRSATTSDQLYVASYADQIGFPTEADRIYEQLLNRNETLLPATEKLSRPHRLACYTGLLRNGARTRPLGELCKIARRFVDEFPEIDEVQNDSAYLALLLGEDLDKAESTVRNLMLKKPELLAYRTTLALSALKRQRTTEAADVYKGWSIDWSTAADRYKAVYVAVMRAAGRPSEADQVAGTIKVANLRPEERQLAGLP